MPYTVFALKWRPQNFDEIIGQSRISTTLKNALEQNRLSHAYLFAGPRGVGKTSTARILAKALNCKEGPTVKPCGKCSSCLEITKGTSLDVIEIDGASNRQIDDIRSLRENAKFSPTSGRFKVYIIDEVHMLTSEAFNALLKTLEEPPPFVKFIFATTHAHKVPSTILSRCQRMDFRRISSLEMVNQLQKIASSEKIEVDKDVLFAIAKSSDGSLRDAESILDQLASFSQNNVSLKDVISVLGLIEQEALFEVTDKIIENKPQEAIMLLDRAIDEGKDMGIFLNGLIEHFRNLMIAKITKGDAKLIDLPQETCEKFLKQSQLLSLEEIFSSFSVLVNTLEIGKRLESLRIPLEISLVKLAQGKKHSNPTVIQQQKPAVQNKQALEHPAMPVQETKKNEVAAENKNNIISITLEDIKGTWQNIISALSRVKMSVATYFNEGIPVKLEKDILTVSFPKNYSLHKESLERKDNKALIEKIILELLNNNVKVNFTLSQEIAHKENEESPFLRSALDTFNGRIVKEE